MSKSEKSQLRVPVLVDRELYEAFKTYSELTGVPVARAVREALSDFAQTSLVARLEALQAKPVSNVVAIDVAQAFAAAQGKC